MRRSDLPLEIHKETCPLFGLESNTSGGLFGRFYVSWKHSGQPAREREDMIPVRTLWRISGVGELARRYFVMNAFDGALTMLGVVVGFFVVRVDKPFLILGAGIGGSIAMGVSGFFGAYLTESAERERESQEWVEAMLEEFDDSLQNQAKTFASIVLAVVDSLAPFLAATVCVFPFFIAFIYNINGSYPLMGMAYAISFLLTAAMLFGLGIFLGYISKRNLLISGLKMLIAGILTSTLILILQVLGLGSH